MKTKLEMAHDWAMENMWKDKYKDLTCLEFAKLSHDYADAMQAEADKRKKEEQDKLKQNERNYHDELVFIGLEEWQPDWSQAPDWAKYFTIDSLGIARFWDYEPTKTSASWFIDDDVVWRCEETAIFNYKGDWRESLRKRPQ